VVRLQNSVRGWNGALHSPVGDARWALAQLRERFGALPVSVIGHSMGGRTAMRVGGEPGVRSVIGLAPWLPAGEPTAQLAGQNVLIIHGTADHTTNPEESHNFADNLRDVAAQVSFIAVPGARHGLLHRRALVEGVAAGFALGTLTRTANTSNETSISTDTPIGSETGPTMAPESESGSIANILQRALAGEASVVV
jgi:dienelactone hydrolase